MSDRLGWGFRSFQTGHDIIMPCVFLAEFWETKTHSGTRGGCHVLTFGSEHDNFIGIRTVDFLNHPSIFTSLMNIDYIPVIVYRVYESEYLSLMKKNEYSTTKKKRPATKDTCGREGYLNTTHSSSLGRIPSFLSIFSQPNISTRLMPANNP